MPISIEALFQGNGDVVEIRGWLSGSGRKRIRGVVKATGEQVVYSLRNFPTVKARQIDAIDQDNKKNNTAKKTKFRSNKVKEAQIEMLPIDKSIGSCIYKLYYGDRYIIHRASNTLEGSLFNILKAYSFFKGHSNVHKETSDKKDYYFAFYNFMRRNQGKELKVDLVLQSADFYELLVCEHNELQKSFAIKKCLNPNITSYIPKRMTLISTEIIERYKKEFDIT